MREFLRRDLLSFQPYVVEESNYAYKMDANESPFSLPQEVKDSFIQWLQEENLNIYPDPDCAVLRESLAALYNLNAKNIFCAVGSDQLIEFISKAFLEPGDFILAPSPSFSMYNITTALNHGQTIEIPLIKTNDNFVYPISSFIDKAKEISPKIIYICSPNNPTGSTISESELTLLLDHVNCPVVLDEAYGEFTDHSFVPLINRYKNLIVLRTFSKAYGLAGARIGYALAHHEMISCLSLVCPPYHLNTMSQMLALFLLASKEQLKDRIAFLKDERERILKAMQGLSFIKPFRTSANFIYCECSFPIGEMMKKKGILIRDFGKISDGNGYAIRVSVSKEEANSSFISVLEGIENETI